MNSTRQNFKRALPLSQPVYDRSSSARLLHGVVAILWSKAGKIAHYDYCKATKGSGGIADQPLKDSLILPKSAPVPSLISCQSQQPKRIACERDLRHKLQRHCNAVVVLVAGRDKPNRCHCVPRDAYQSMGPHSTSIFNSPPQFITWSFGRSHELLQTQQAEGHLFSWKSKAAIIIACLPEEGGTFRFIQATIQLGPQFPQLFEQSALFLYSISACACISPGQFPIGMQARTCAICTFVAPGAGLERFCFDSLVSRLQATRCFGPPPLSTGFFAACSATSTWHIKEEFW